MDLTIFMNFVLCTYSVIWMFLNVVRQLSEICCLLQNSVKTTVISGNNKECVVVMRSFSEFFCLFIPVESHTPFLYFVCYILKGRTLMYFPPPIPGKKKQGNGVVGIMHFLLCSNQSFP